MTTVFLAGFVLGVGIALGQDVTRCLWWRIVRGGKRPWL